MQLKAEFLEAMKDSGIVCNEFIVDDGKIHRFASGGNGSKDCAYMMVRSGAGAGGYYQDWKNGITGTWCSGNNNKLSRADWEAINAERAKRDAELIKQYAAAAVEANKLWESSVIAVDHPYLAAKKISANGARVASDGTLLIPVRNVRGEIQSVQAIAKKKDSKGHWFKKNFMDAKMSGGFWWIGGVTDKIMICEGYATACTLHEVYGCRVVIAFGCHNLESVAKAVRGKYTDLDIIVMGDNNSNSIGQDCANKAAKLIGASVMIPTDTDTDWNDYYTSGGVQVQLIRDTSPTSAPVIEIVKNEKYDLKNDDDALKLAHAIAKKLEDSKSELEAVSVIADMVTEYNVKGCEKKHIGFLVGIVCEECEGIRRKKTDIIKALPAEINKKRKEKKVFVARTDAVSMKESLDRDLFPHKIERADGTVSIPCTVENLAYLLDSYGIAVCYNEVLKTESVLIPNDSNEYHDLHAEACIERIRSLAALNDISTRITDSLPVLLKKNSINPIKLWIFSKVWDGVSRVNQLANHLIVSPNERDLATKIFRAWMVQCIAALDKAEIGCKLNPIAVPKYELILILQGIQGVLKTTFFSSLLPSDISPIYIKTSSHLDIKSRDSVKQNVSCWINELGEFDSTTKKNEISMIKAFTSAQSDVMRLAFGRKDLTLKRGVSFCGTVNDERFLGDTTGSRRFGVIRITDIARNEMDMQQLWAEVWGLYASGEKWWLDKVDESEMQTHNQKYHQLINPIEDALESKYDFTILGTNRMTATQIYRECFVDKVPTQKDLNTLAAYLVKKGIVKVMGKGVTIYKMP